LVITKALDSLSPLLVGLFPATRKIHIISAMTFRDTCQVVISCHIHPFSRRWSQNTITWNNRPSPGAILSSAQVGNQILWYEWDVTTNVREQINAGEPLASFVFRASNITQDIVLINSLEADVNQPLLIVLPPAPTQSVVNPTDDAYVRGGEYLYAQHRKFESIFSNKDKRINPFFPLGAYQNTNFGLLAELIVREGSTNSGTRRSYLKFPLNNLATITNTQKVLLRVFGYFQGTGTSVIDCHTSTNIKYVILFPQTFCLLTITQVGIKTLLLGPLDLPSVPATSLKLMPLILPRG
jgi:hypothetical protein